jgi:hypothetical protein
MVFTQLPSIRHPSQGENLQAVDEPVGDRSGLRCRIADLFPVSKEQVGEHHGGCALRPLTDELEEDVCALLAQGKITQRVTTRRFGRWWWNLFTTEWLFPPGHRIAALAPRISPLGCGLRILLGQFASIAGPSQDEHLGVVHEAVGNRGGHGGGIEHLAPFRKRQVGGDHGGLVLMPPTDDLEEQV